MKELGVELIQADLDDRTSLERAFAGAHGTFCVTNFWERFSAHKAIEQAGNQAEAEKAAGVEHVIWSSPFGSGGRAKLSPDGRGAAGLAYPSR